MAMKTITFSCETITPMFLSGADGSTPELRPPSIKGALRFWWRAMNGHLSLEELKKREDYIFGGSGNRSKISIRTKFNEKDLLLKSKSNLKRDKKLQTHFNKGKIEGRDVGVSYLLYSTILPDKTKEYIDIEFKFDVIFQVNDEDSINDFIVAFWLLTNFSGLGTRSRRCGGNFKVTSIEDKNNFLQKIKLDFNEDQNSNLSLKDYYQNQFKIIESSLAKTESTKQNNTYSSLVDASIKINNQPTKDFLSALNYLGKAYKDFREEERGSSHLLSKACFGLPIMSNATQEEVIATNFNRRSSPLIFSLIEFQKGKYYSIIIKMGGDFLPKKETVTLKESKKNGLDLDTQVPNLDKLNDFFDMFKKVTNIK